MKLVQLLEAANKHFVMLVRARNDITLSFGSDPENLFKEAEDNGYLDGENVFVQIGTRIKVDEPIDIVGGRLENEIVFEKVGHNVKVDKFNIFKPLDSMIDSDNPQAAALAKKLADRKAKK